MCTKQKSNQFVVIRHYRVILKKGLQPLSDEYFFGVKSFIRRQVDDIEA